MIRFGITRQLIHLPLTAPLTSGRIPHDFELIRQSPEKNCRDLLAGRLEMAWITPLDYMHYSGQLEIFHQWAVLSRGASAYALLFFRENMDQIRRVAVQEDASYYSNVARVVLQEVYQLTPEWETVPLQQDLAIELGLHETIFLEQERAMREAVLQENCLDLIQEWCEQMDASFTHLLLCKQRDRRLNLDHTPLQLALNHGLRNLMKLVQEATQEGPIPWHFLLELLQQSYAFVPTAEDWYALNELMRYFYYLGRVEHISELHLI